MVEETPFWEDPNIWPAEAHDARITPDSSQAALMGKLVAVAGDPVYELKSIFGVNHRTAERWISGATTMRYPLQLKLAMSLVGIAEAQKRLAEMPARDRLFMQIASTRLPLESLPKED
ncbi:hypothetical protein [Aureimonas sp. SK2]|uniref:hypothetical protein n=1 Tax=Aureimonas sp. SK2 TaxID=3015992 RepID=UPI002444A255|nr:hypothetical protein [Aureimonas sp. SK2]